ncbi:4Fe-4S dicluster domain-containing protein [Desulfallas thermosapovorans]|uniref:4Fe-4S dicluster protein n=1 Tax=Desulfallas thermosapovorans DSM 6562 TaxID=1121431 RepID=A0A5S4ZU94_9FIRM|nr:4Fe-4S binding protein [Desulfallas thermosapovorans]TYO96469.1 4Fe-4S dicluster protein [Desulfallas thermosapovorans DSM 6562]
MSGQDFIIEFNTARCKKCGLCSHYCPQGVIARDKQGYPYVSAPEKCKQCYLCYHRCPDFALEVKDFDRESVSAG